MDERPVTLKRRQPSSSSCESLVCIVHYEHCRETDIRPLSYAQFLSVCKAAETRQAQKSEGHRLSDICKFIPSEFEDEVHGCHRWCFKNFTNICRLSMGHNSNEATENVQPRYHPRSSSQTRTLDTRAHTALFPQDSCMFCCRHVKQSNSKKEFLSKCTSEAAERKIRDHAVTRNDCRVLQMIQGEDLRARQARYHESCRRDYVRDDIRQHHPPGKRFEGDLKAAHVDCFRDLCNFVQLNVIEQGEVHRMSMLRAHYIGHMLQRHPEYYNADYPTQKLKAKLVAHFGDSLEFWLPKASCKSELVFSSGIDIGEAVEVAFDALSSDSVILKKAATLLSNSIHVAFAQSPALPWPPSVEDLQTVSPPVVLTDFLCAVIAGPNNNSHSYSSRTTQVAQSVAEDICYATTKGHWAMPKHVQLGLSLHHLTGSAEIVRLINRYGHCQSYSKLLELETAMAYEVQAVDPVLPSNISLTGNLVCHTCFDNFDLNEETPSGSGTTHTTHGIVIQELLPNIQNEKHLPVKEIERKCRSFRYVPVQVELAGTTRKAEPGIVAKKSLSDCSSVFLDDRGLMWVVAHGLYNSTGTVPDWSGWLSRTAVADIHHQQSNIGYLAPILHPITQAATVQQCLTTSMDISRKLQQKYTFVTFDLAAAKIAYNVIWNNPERYKGLTVHLGAFHIMCCYLGALGRMMSGSGFEEVVLESGICSSGSIEQVLNGKHYNRAVRVHQLMMIALDKLLLEQFVQQSGFDMSTVPQLQQLADSPSTATFLAAEESAASRTFLDSFLSFADSARQGAFGPTCKFWMQYHDCVWTLLTLLLSIKENDVPTYMKSLRQMCPLIFAADRLHYARYLPMYHAQLSHLMTECPEAFELLKANGLTVARSNVPACRNAVDITIEQTINRSAKTTGGIVGFSRNVNAYHRWCLTRHKRAQFLEATRARIGITSSAADVGSSNRKAQTKRMHSNVQNICNAFRNFLNPMSCWAEGDCHLYCISSGQPAADDVADNLLAYITQGESATQTFIHERLITKSVNFHQPMKKMQLKTFAAMALQVEVKSSKQKSIQLKAERNLLGQLLLLCQTHNICFDKLFSYPLAPVPWSLATADGSMCKTNKAQLLHALSPESFEEKPDYCVYIVDGNALLHAILQIPATFGDFARTVFDCLPKAAVVHFVTDSYMKHSVKETERQRRGTSAVHIIGGPSTRTPRDFSSFLKNADNKRHLLQFILREWQQNTYASKLFGRRILFVCEESCMELQSVDGFSVTCTQISALCSQQEEADTRIILHCLYAAEHHLSDSGSCLVVKSPDTDVFVILLLYTSTINANILFETGTGNNHRYISVSKVFSTIGNEVAAALPALHAFTGCDSTSAFIHKGKKRPFQLLKTKPDFIDAFCSLGQVADLVDDKALSVLEHFVCCLYSSANVSDVNKVRSTLFQTRYSVGLPQSMLSARSSGIDLSLLPPCRGSLYKHIMRANYQTFIWRHAHMPSVDLPSPSGCGWTIDDSGIHIDWVDRDIIPMQLVDILAESGNDDNALWLEEDDVVDNIVDDIFDDDVDDD